MKKRVSILLFLAGILIFIAQFHYQVDGTAGYLIVLSAVLFIMASIVIGDKLKEFFFLILEFFL
ncbi:MAG TPA: hypothetical protein VK861_06730 [Bacteroidales bacterium]|nr:hypothetical protein [Bacteroidales bacterium]